MKTWLKAIEIIITLVAMAVDCLSQEPPTPPPPPSPPDTPVASIVIVDSHGQAVTDEVGYGQQIVITTDKAVRGKGNLSLVLLIEPTMQAFTTPDGATMVVTTPSVDTTITITEMVALGDKIAWQKVKLKCGKGSLPPPPGPTPPGPTPEPNPPTPNASALFLATYRDPLTPNADVGATLSAFGLWEMFRDRGHQFRHYTPSTTEVMGKKVKADAMKANIPPPGASLVIYELGSMKWIATIPLPKSSELAETVAKYSSLGIKQ